MTSQFSDRKEKIGHQPISEAERERRRKQVAGAHADNRIEGIMPDPESIKIGNAYINGEIEVAELGRQVDMITKSRIDAKQLEIKNI